MPNHARLASVALGLCSAVLFSACGEHVVVVDLINLSTEATSIAAYYRIDSDSYHASALQSGQFQIASPALGIRPPASRDGTLNVQVLAYKNNVPCALNKGSTDANIGTSGKISATAVLDSVTFTPCHANDAPVKYPLEARVWAGAPNNAWMVGKDGTVLRWDGALFREVVLPASVLGSNAPSWKAVRGDNQGNVWFVGDGDSVVRLDSSGNATRFALDFGSNSQVPMTWTGIYAESGTAYLSGTTTGDSQGYIGVLTPATGRIAVNQVSAAPIGLAGKSYGLYSVDCSSLADCWYGGVQSVVIHYTGGTSYASVPLQSDKSCSSDKSFVNVNSIYASATLASVKMVGGANDGAGPGLFISYDPTGKCFFVNEQDASTAATPGPLYGIAGRRPDDLVAVGQNAVYRWKTTGPVLLTGTPIGVWQSVSATPNGFFATAKTGELYYADLP